ncbi:glutathione S-transferase A4-like [Lampetra fluviatilis]
MSSKAKLVYFDGRGRMESIRWVLAAAGIEFEEEFLKTKDEYQKLLKDGVLLYEQLPMVEMDGMRLVQTRAIINYVADKAGMQPRDARQRAHVDMYVEGMRDLGELMLPLAFLKPEEFEQRLKQVEDKASKRYLPVYEKVLGDGGGGGGFLVGTSLTVADVLLLELLLALEERFPKLLSGFPHLQEFKGRLSQEPNIKRFLQPGSQRKAMPDQVYVDTVRSVYNI